MPRFFENTKKKVLIVLFFFIFSNNLFAETLSSSQTNTSTDTIQDYTINTGVILTILNTTTGLKITGCERTFKNYGTILSTEDDESSTNITIKAVGGDGAYDVKIFNYGTIHQENKSAILFLTTMIEMAMVLVLMYTTKALSSLMMNGQYDITHLIILNLITMEL